MNAEPHGRPFGDGELPDDPFTDDEFRYGELDDERPYTTPPMFDGDSPTAPRRPELLGDAVDSWWQDLTGWADWMNATFRVGHRFPPCWPQHPALVEELMALWLHWQAAWLPGVDATGPTGFLRELDAALSRVERLWRPPCTTDRHRPQPPITTATTTGTAPELRPWWTNPEYQKGIST